MSPTPHNSAKMGDFAETVLMPGDPLRAKYIADNFLENAVLVNNVRGINGYTGLYNGKRVSVMASGMGVASIGIYSYELYNFYGVENIIRVGSAGSMQPDIELKDIIFAMGSCTDSNFGSQYNLPGKFAFTASYSLLEKAVAQARKMKLRHRIGNVYSTEAFYDNRENTEKWAKMGVLAVEMEAAALYMNAAVARKNALCICTVSDEVFGSGSLSAEDRQIGFAEMIKLALEIA